MHSDYDAVLFDFDGTLVPCLDLHDMKRQVVELTCARTAFDANAAAGLLAVELIECAVRVQRPGGGDGAAFRREAHALVREIELAAARRTELYPGVRELLDGLRTRRVATGVVTRNCADAVRLMFPDIDSYCGAVLTRDDVEYLKPDTRHLGQCLAALGAAAARAAMVGDGALDMAAGRALGMHCIGVLGGHSGRRALENAGADRIVGGVTGLARILSARARPSPAVSTSARRPHRLRKESL